MTTQKLVSVCFMAKDEKGNAAGLKSKPLVMTEEAARLVSRILNTGMSNTKQRTKFTPN